MIAETSGLPEDICFFIMEEFFPRDIAPIFFMVLWDSAMNSFIDNGSYNGVTIEDITQFFNRVLAFYSSPEPQTPNIFPGFGLRPMKSDRKYSDYVSVFLDLSIVAPLGSIFRRLFQSIGYKLKTVPIKSAYEFKNFRVCEHFSDDEWDDTLPTETGKVFRTDGNNLLVIMVVPDDEPISQNTFKNCKDGRQYRVNVVTPEKKLSIMSPPWNRRTKTLTIMIPSIITLSKEETRGIIETFPPALRKKVFDRFIKDQPRIVRPSHEEEEYDY
jgi:hypothetical protein